MGDKYVINSAHMGCKIGDEFALLNASNNQYYGLNPVATFIWKQMQNPISIEALQAKVEEEFDVEPRRCRDDLEKIVQEMLAENLLAIAS